MVVIIPRTEYTSECIFPSVMKIITRFLNQVRTHWILSLLAVLLLVGGGWWFFGRSAETVKLTFEHPIRTKITQSLDVSGTINAKQKARLRFLAGGKVVFVGPQQGDFVKKWQTLATVDRASLLKQQDQILNKYMQERLDWETTLDTTKDGAQTTIQNRVKDKDQLDLTNKVLDVEIQDIAIKNTVLSAPFDGILTVSPTAVAGVQLTAADYFEVVNPGSLYFSAVVDEADIAKVTPGLRSELVLDAFADETIQTQVRSVSFTSTVGDNGTAFAVEFPLSAAQFSNKLRLGMNGDIRIILDEKEGVLTIPISATRTRDGKMFVDIKKDEKTTEEREIAVGLESDEAVEVVSGLTEQDLVLIP